MIYYITNPRKIYPLFYVYYSYLYYIIIYIIGPILLIPIITSDDITWGKWIKCIFFLLFRLENWSLGFSISRKASGLVEDSHGFSKEMFRIVPPVKCMSRIFMTFWWFVRYLSQWNLPRGNPFCGVLAAENGWMMDKIHIIRQFHLKLLLLTKRPRDH